MSAGMRGKYTPEFKLEAVRLVQGGQSVPVTATILGMPTQTLGNWVRLSEEGTLIGAGDKPVSNGQMELARLRAEYDAGGLDPAMTGRSGLFHRTGTQGRRTPSEAQSPDRQGAVCPNQGRWL